MEFPDLGENCSVGSCNQLDFLPVKCDACKKVFCKIHYSYTQHNCPEAYRRNNQVPVCPLCNAPVPLKPGELPDVVVGQHIDNDCQSEKAQSRRKIYSNRCATKGCKQKELIPFVCQKCRKNFCLKHRHEMDHHCAGFEGSGRAVSNSGAAAIARVEKPKEATKPPQSSLLSSIGADLNRERLMRQENSRAVPDFSSLMISNMSEEEQLRLAKAASLQEHQGSVPPPPASLTEEEKRQQEMYDEALARALQESEQDARTQNANRQTSSEKKQCLMS